MKKIIGLMMMLGGVVTFSQAQKLSSSKVPTQVKSAFSKLHPTLTKVNWEKEKANFEVGFMLNGIQTSEVYTPKGVLTETEVEIKTSELPEAVKKKLTGIKITEAAKITKSDKSIIYEAEVKGKDLLFDAKGNSVKP